MRVLVIGSGGREHALAWKLAQSPQINQVYCIPGNGGTAVIPKCLNVSLTLNDFEGMLRFAQVQGVGLTVIGPELPLAQGLADLFMQAGLAVFGPTKMGAQIEASKAWAKELMQGAGIPTAEFAVFTDPSAAKAHLSRCQLPIVIKADGLAGGKGVTVAQSWEQAQLAIDQVFTSHARVVIETFLEGEELSVLAITDGETIIPLLPARDHKRIGEGDTGPNTGGMGAYAPAALGTPELLAKVQAQILEPTLAALRARGIIYRGCLYAGLMVDNKGDPKVVEFNCRFGDPETQVILPLLASPLEKLMLACIEGKLAKLSPIQWQQQSAVCVILAARGYPDRPETGQLISGVGKAESLGAIVFHSGTRLKNNQLLSSGGRVLGITALGDNLTNAKKLAYQAIEHIYFDGMQYRRDIAVNA
ncbi:MAG: phosphoribosylamine--glycine ligase [Pseudanabaenaceae cyanobacterium]